MATETVAPDCLYYEQESPRQHVVIVEINGEEVLCKRCKTREDALRLLENELTKQARELVRLGVVL